MILFVEKYTQTHRAVQYDDNVIIYTSKKIIGSKIEIKWIHEIICCNNLSYNKKYEIDLFISQKYRIGSFIHTSSTAFYHVNIVKKLKRFK